MKSHLKKFCWRKIGIFRNFSCMFLNLYLNCSNLLYMRNLQEQVKKAFCYQKVFQPFTVWINCSSDLKKISNSRPSVSNFKGFSWSLEHFFLTVGQNNFGNKIPFFHIFSHRKFCIVWARDVSQVSQPPLRKLSRTVKNKQSI